jgi:hypothetical protein
MILIAIRSTPDKINLAQDPGPHLGHRHHQLIKAFDGCSVLGL